MTISTKKPSKSPLGYTITFVANGGTFADGATINEMVYSKNGSIVSGTYYKPNGDSSFIGWYTKEKDGTEYKVKEDGNLVTPLTEDITVYAHYKPPMKYAVAIYGICVDELESGQAGLTFGPALGRNYVQSFKRHVPSEKTELGNAHRCVHDDDWNTIIKWNKKDPYVYEQCIKEGCTHSVALSKKTTTTILSEQFDPIKETGDGPSGLSFELVTNNENCWENLRWHPNGGENGTTTGGWGASRIRAMLNGADELTDKSEDNYSSRASSDVHKSASVYTEENCLFATFPQELQKAIGKRQVKYDSVYNEKTEKTNDKLWLFSPNELADTISYEQYNHPLECNIKDNPYEKFKGTGDGYNSNTVRRPFFVNSSNEMGYNAWAWLRSSGRGDIYSKYTLYLTYAGGVGSNSASEYLGVCVGFTLER